MKLARRTEGRPRSQELRGPLNTQCTSLTIVAQPFRIKRREPFVKARVFGSVPGIIVDLGGE